MSAFPFEYFHALLPLACDWAREQEQTILREGVPLSAAEAEDARAIGVMHPARVRLLKVERIPVPDHPSLRAATDATQLISALTGGLTVRYGIFVRSDCWRQQALIVHELVHTSQYERLGGFEPFLQQYLLECLTIGYPDAPMEQEAIQTTARVAGKRHR